ncbi:MAG: hypothetical protein ABIG34_04490 [Candidatus Peregrinibacteria bacterium]
MLQPHYIAFFGAFLAAIGSFFIAQEKNKHRFLTALVIFIGAILSAIGTYMQENEVKSVITGGDSYCYLSVDAGGGEGGWISNPMIACKGEYPMYDVSVRFYDPDDFSDLQPGISMEEFTKNDIFSRDFGNFGIGETGKGFSLTRQIDLEGRERKILKAVIHARNGFFTEEFLIKKVGNRWLRAWRLYKGYSSELIDEWSEPDFPKNSDGKILWD